MITWLASYPKSGNTWLRLLLEAYKTGAVDLNNVSIRLDDLPEYHWQRVISVPLHKLDQQDAAYYRIAVIRHLMDTAPPPLYVKTHSVIGHVQGVPTIPVSLTANALYIVRDPRDIVLSYAAFTERSVDDTIALLGNPDHVLVKNLGLYHFIGDWPTHVRSWQQAPFAVHFERYEDFHTEPAAVLGRVLEALHVKREPERIARAVELTDFAALQKQEQETGFREGPPTGKPFFRSGRAGAWRDELTDDQVARVEDACGDVMEQWGYPLVTRAAKQAAE